MITRKCEFKNCDKMAHNKVGFVGFEIASCADHIDIMMDRSTDYNNRLNTLRLNLVRAVIGKEEPKI